MRCRRRIAWVPVAAALLAAGTVRAQDPPEVAALLERADDLWPPHPARIPELEAWIRDAERLAAGAPRAVWTDARTGLLSPAPDAVSERHGWSVPRRLAFARRVRAGLAPGGAWEDRWRAAAAAVRTDARFAGLELRPQAGLVPLGADPTSGLLEFWHVASGAEPRRAPDGRLVEAEDAGLVLVLLPSGTFRMGAQADDPDGPNFDPQAAPDEGPVHVVTLAPFFLAKHELTQAQWRTFTGVEPSEWGHDHWRDGWLAGNAAPTLRMPVERVDWDACRRECLRMGLDLPTEAQWEYACRAGTDTPWWTGPDPQCLRGVANLADSYARAHEAPSGWPFELWLDDGAAAHAHVGTYLENPFGLSEMHGNMLEWCLDAPSPYTPAPTVDPLAPWEGTTRRILRGGGFSTSAAQARSSARAPAKPTRAAVNVSVRPARALEG